jgi:hypothetical protein
MKAIDRYWRQVRAIESMTGASSAIARRAVTRLRDERDYATAAETRRHPRIVARVVTEILEETKQPYRDLDDFLDAYDEWDGEYEIYDVETNADY